MTDLNTLRPEVMEAAAKLDDFDSAFGTGGHWQIIRAELLRLADDCARLVDCINAQPPTRRSLIDRAERAEAELAAIKARIAEAPVADVIALKNGCGRVDIWGLPHDWVGQRVALVKVED